MKSKVGTGARGMAAALIFVCGFTSVRAASLEELQKAIEAKCLTHTSISYRVECATQYTTNKSYEVALYEAVLEGGKWKKRTDSKILREVTVGDSSKPLRKEVVIVDDGVNLFTLDDLNGQKTAMKLKSPNVDESRNVEDTFGDIRVGNVITFLPDETMLGQPVYVLDVKSEKKKYVGKFYICQETGTVLKATQTYGEDKGVTISITVSDFKLDAPIPADHFVFTPPEGVTLVDRTVKPGTK